MKDIKMKIMVIKDHTSGGNSCSSNNIKGNTIRNTKLPQLTRWILKYIQVPVFCIFLLFANVLFAQTQAWRTGIPDTSYSNYSDYQHNKVSFPFIELVKDTNFSNVEQYRNQTYAQIGERRLKIDGFIPKNAPPPTPVVLIIHGGGWRSGNKNQHIPMAQHLAANGIASFTVEYRLSTEAFYPAAIYDLKAAVRWLRATAAKFNLDSTKISVLGFSAGGQLAALVGVTNGIQKFEGKEERDNPLHNHSSKVSSVIDIDGTLSFVHPDAWETQNQSTIGPSAWWIGYPRTERIDLWQEASPLTYANSNNVPFLFLNSSIERMHAGQNDFIHTMNQKGVYVKAVNFKDTPHSFCLYRPWFDQVITEIVTFIHHQ